jgi:hypothetical protein
VLTQFGGGGHPQQDRDRARPGCDARFLPVIGSLDDVVGVALARRYVARQMPGRTLAGTAAAWRERKRAPPPAARQSPVGVASAARTPAARTAAERVAMS